MFHLRKHALPLPPLRLAHLLLTPPRPPLRLRRCLAGHFAFEDYLVTTYGLTPEQALKGAKYISHCKSPSNADSVLAFLTGPALRLSKADIAHLVAHDPRILNCSVDNTLKVRVTSFLSHDLSPAQIQSFVHLASCVFRSFNIYEKPKGKKKTAPAQLSDGGASGGDVDSYRSLW